MQEKIQPWMSPILDNLEVLLKNFDDTEQDELLEQGIISFIPISYLRGRNFHTKYVIIDEAQNLELHEVKTILTRVGRGTKIVFTGDPDQIDHKFLDQSSNGLIKMTKAFLPYQLAGAVSLKNCERSELADLASRIL